MKRSADADADADAPVGGPVGGPVGASGGASGGGPVGVLILGDEWVSLFSSFMEEGATDECGVANLRIEDYQLISELPWPLNSGPRDDMVLDCHIGPFANRSPVIINGDSLVAHYCRTVLDETLKYINNAHIFYADKQTNPAGRSVGVAYTHGGIGLVSEMIFHVTERAFPEHLHKVFNSSSIKLSDINADVSEVVMYHLEYSGLVANHMAMHKTCTSKADALQWMHPQLTTVVVAPPVDHASGLVTILYEEDPVSGSNKYVVFTDPASATLIFDDGTFTGKGTWALGDYVYGTNDCLIGTRIRIPNTEVEMSSTPYFRVVGKVETGRTHQIDDMYICVNYPEVGRAKIVFIFLDDEQQCFRLYNPTDRDLELRLDRLGFEFVCPTTEIENLVSLVKDHNYAIDEWTPKAIPKATSGAASRATPKVSSIVGGDLKGSIDHLHDFLNHACDLMGIYRDEEDDEVAKNLDMDKYGDFAKSGFDPSALSVKQRMVFHLSECILELRSLHETLGAPPQTVQTASQSASSFDLTSSFSPTCSFSALKLVCTGDCIGIPKDTSGDTPGGLLDNYLCMLWANAFCDIKLVGSRELNKLRLLSQLPVSECRL